MTISLEPRRVGRRRATGLIFAIWLVLASFASTTTSTVSAATSCANAIVCENQIAGIDPSIWDVTGAGDPSIQGFSADISVNKGSTISFKISTTATSYSIDLYRFGYYQGNGARKVASISPSAQLPQGQPPCLTDIPTGLIDCGNWAGSASWAVPSTAVSGVYMALLIRSDTGGSSQIPFIVRDDASHSDMLFQTDDTTWQAYNQYGGNSLYNGSAPTADGRAYKVSYNRPFATRGQAAGNGPSNYFFYAEYPMIRFLEANGYDISYASGVDADRSGALIKNHKILVTAGHDEYWSVGMRDNVEAARNTGVNIAFFTGNEVFWKTRFENSIDGSGTSYRTLVCYKETKSAQRLDPTPTWTGTWRDPTWSPPADGGRPENALGGTIFTVNRGSAAITVPAAYSKLRIWRNTSVATLAAGQTAALGINTLGYEWDEDLDNGFRPPGLFDLSSTTVNVPEHILDYGNTYGPATVTHHLTLYRAPSGALVFGAGTVQWAWGLDVNHDTQPDIGPSSPDTRMQQATVNLFADMGVQPATMISGLVSASASNDRAAPTSAVATPTASSTLTSGSQTTISGTAADTGGGIVAGVEVSVDGGTTWHPATGTTNWTYAWTPGPTGPTTIRSRSVDDSGNLETAAAGASVTVAPRPCPCSLFSSTATPAIASSNDANQLEVGVKFTADTSGYIYGISFFKGTGNTGTHVANLWTSTGALLATATFTNETASGWQTSSFAGPVAITSGAVYVASYHTNAGQYAATVGAFTSKLDVWPLHAPSGANGVYQYGASQFPTQTYNSTNYWVDVVYNTVDTVAPVVTTVSPLANATNVPVTSAVTARFSKSVVASSINLSVAAGGARIAGGTTYTDATRTATFTPLAPFAQGATFTATVSGATDSSGNVIATPFSWSFTTATCPCNLWPSTATPPQASANDTSQVEVGVRFTSEANGYINGIRFYKGATNTGTHVGNLWSVSGQLLASGTFSGESASGWQQMNFSTPVSIAAGAVYVASYHTNTGGYSYTGAYFGAAYDAAPLHAPASAAGAGNGVYLYGPSAFPTQSYNAANYWVDVVFNTVFVDSVPPSVTTQTPTPGATKVPVTSTATATFNKAVTPATISFAIKAPSGSALPATLTYDASKLTANLAPTAALTLGTTYTATVSGATDGSGNVMAPVSWTFTTVACPCTIFGASAAPTTPSVNDPNSVELGVKFSTAVNGTITGVRFFKGGANTGTHVANLWTATGTLLATATFTGETTSGWQQVNFTTPVSVTANTTYVVSYHTNTGNYAADGGYFATQGAGAWPVTALGAGVAGPNGVYAYGASSTFPTGSWNSTNYWVDVVFAIG
jgi:hypothetical protein